MYLPIPYKIQYDIEKFKFKEILEDILEVDDLYNLHNVYEYKLLVRDTDQHTIWHSRYYSNFETKFKPTYLEFVRDLKEKLGYETLVYQCVPTFRVQLGNGNVGVGDWHKDKTYNHGLAEVNFWVPFTDTENLNTIWMESREDLGDYKPYPVKYGEALIFNGASLYHGNKRNTTNKTRVSVDFRLVDPTKFEGSNKTSINTKAKFDIGGYFKIM